MAEITDIYANEKIQEEKLAEAVNVAGNKNVTMIQTVSFNTEDIAGSIYRVFKVGANLIPVSLKIITEAIAGLSVDIGIYEEDGEAYDKAALASGLSLAAAAGVDEPLNGLSALTVDTYGQKIYELAGDTVGTKDTGYDIALTLGSAATAAGKAIVIGEFVQG